MTDFLFARPSVIEGIGRNIDFFGSLNTYNSSPNGEIADRIAQTADLCAIYNDIYTAYLKTICQQEIRKSAEI